MSFFADIPAPANCKLYVGNLGNEGTKEELEKAFGHYGPLHEVWLARNPPGFAFVTFQESRHAKAALKDLNGQQICGRRVRVEWARKCNSRMRFQFPLGGHAARRQFCAAMKSSNLSVFINGQRYL